MWVCVLWGLLKSSFGDSMYFVSDSLSAGVCQ